MGLKREEEEEEHKGRFAFFSLHEKIILFNNGLNLPFPFPPSIFLLHTECIISSTARLPSIHLATGFPSVRVFSSSHPTVFRLVSSLCTMERKYHFLRVCFLFLFFFAPFSFMLIALRAPLVLLFLLPLSCCLPHGPAK